MWEGKKKEWTLDLFAKTDSAVAKLEALNASSLWGGGLREEGRKIISRKKSNIHVIVYACDGSYHSGVSMN